jgi:hypothetical protein
LAENWTADLYQFEWNPTTGGVDGEIIGSAGLVFEDASHARFDWALSGRSGSEPFEVLLMSNERTLRNYTGTWYDPDEPGWGLTLYAQGNARVGILYFYDANNQARWLLGQGDNEPQADLEMLSFVGFCPDCERRDPEISDGGRLHLDFDDERSAILTAEVEYPRQPGGNWPRQNVVIVPLSDAWVDPKVQ